MRNNVRRWAYHVQNTSSLTSFSSQVFNTFAVSDVTSMSLVKQCQYLEAKLGTNKFTFSANQRCHWEIWKNAVSKQTGCRVLKSQKTIQLCSLPSVLRWKMHGWSSGMLTSLLWLSLATESSQQETTPTLSLKSLLCGHFLQYYLIISVFKHFTTWLVYCKMLIVC